MNAERVLERLERGIVVHPVHVAIVEVRDDDPQPIVERHHAGWPAPRIALVPRVVIVYLRQSEEMWPASVDRAGRWRAMMRGMVKEWGRLWPKRTGRGTGWSMS